MLNDYLIVMILNYEGTNQYTSMHITLKDHITPMNMLKCWLGYGPNLLQYHV